MPDTLILSGDAGAGTTLSDDAPAQATLRLSGGSASSTTLALEQTTTDTTEASLGTLVLDAELERGDKGDKGDPGIQGQEGPQGPPGVTPEPYIFIQNSPAASVVVAHGFGYDPQVELTDATGQRISIFGCRVLTTGVSLLTLLSPIAFTATFS